MAADHLIPLGLVTLADNAPVRAGQQTAGVLVGVDPRRADPGGLQHRHGLGLQARQRHRLRLVSVGVEEQRIIGPRPTAELLLKPATCDSSAAA